MGNRYYLGCSRCGSRWRILVWRSHPTQASVGREFGVTAGTIRRWIDAIYPPPPKQEMFDMYGSTTEIYHAYGSPFPQRYRDLNTNQRRKLRDEYVEHFRGRCLYCGLKLDGKPSRIVRDSVDEIEWDDLPGGKEGFLSNPIHLHHDHGTGLTLGPVHALCNAHSWHFYELPVRMQKLLDKVNSMSTAEREAFAARTRKRFG